MKTSVPLNSFVTVFPLSESRLNCSDECVNVMCHSVICCSSSCLQSQGQHDHSKHGADQEEDMATAFDGVWKGLTALAGIYLLFIIEHCIGMFKHYKDQRVSYLDPAAGDGVGHYQMLNLCFCLRFCLLFKLF